MSVALRRVPLIQCLLVTLTAQQSGLADGGYRTPPRPIADLINAPTTPGTSVDPHHHWMLLMDRPSLPSIEELSQPELRIAGMRLNPATNGPSRRSYYTGLTLRTLNGDEQHPIRGLPADARIRDVRWSANGQHFAFTLTTASGTELWAAGVQDRQARRLIGPRLNAAYGRSYAWVSDQARLLCRVLPADRGAAPVDSGVPIGPVTQENLGRKAPARTYQDLLEDPHDAALFDHYMTSQVVRVDLQGQVQVLGQPGIYTRAAPSPDGRFLLVEQILRPYSYLVPASRFPLRAEIWSASGDIVKRVADLPLAEEVPVSFGSVRTGPRSFGWRADAGATLYWAEAADGGDPTRQVEVRDRVFTLAAPFEGQPENLMNCGLRFGGITWGNDQLAMASEWWWKTRRSRTWILSPNRPGSEPQLLFDRSWEDRYSDPGSPLTSPNAFGRDVLLTVNGGQQLFYSGTGASPEGNRPFLDALDLSTRETTRLWRSAAPYYESVVELLDPEKMHLLTRRESVEEPPNYHIRDLQSGDSKQITAFPHPTPQLKGVYKEMIRYKRDDGVDLTATLYLPPGKKPEDGPFPMLMWAYPQEFKSAAAAGQVTDSPYRFVRSRPTSPLNWLVLGYAVLDDPGLPIIGEGSAEPNDTYVKQLVAGARAAVDEVVRRGVADPRRLAIGGHSYGAFMTANLLAHSDLFQAGIARSGAYNRTLTPFSFQAEERTFWQAPEIYFAMSPFMHAHKINEPILLIHGAADNNSGTFPMQSKRFYAALKGLGATARLVMLPNESHGYRARESVMHMAWETTAWLDKYVKNADAGSLTP